MDLEDTMSLSLQEDLAYRDHSEVDVCDEIPDSQPDPEPSFNPALDSPVPPASPEACRDVPEASSPPRQTSISPIDPFSPEHQPTTMPRRNPLEAGKKRSNSLPEKMRAISSKVSGLTQSCSMY